MLSKIGLLWQHYHAEVLPYINRDYEVKPHDMKALVCYLANEHALVFLNHKPVSIEFKEKREPFTQKILNDEYRVKQKQLEEIKKFKKEKGLGNIKSQTRAQIKVNKRWSNISKDEVERLVWTKPTIELAREFGVSDVAIAN